MTLQNKKMNLEFMFYQTIYYSNFQTSKRIIFRNLKLESEILSEFPKISLPFRKNINSLI